MDFQTDTYRCEFCSEMGWVTVFNDMSIETSPLGHRVEYWEGIRVDWCPKGAYRSFREGV